MSTNLNNSDFDLATLKGSVIQQRAWLRANLVNRLFRLGNALQNQTQALLAVESADLSVVQFRIMLRLSQAGSQNVQGIADLLGTDRSNVSRALPSLLEKGWIDQQPSAEDRRQSIITLTQAGERKVTQSRNGTDARLRALRAAFNNDEFEQLLAYLDRLDEVLAMSSDSFSLSPGSVLELRKSA
ncbi:MAG: MarR family winged helix-turn-helix transcriptional regulator [Alphaproteobacteria bacterium]